MNSTHHNPSSKFSPAGPSPRFDRNPGTDRSAKIDREPDTIKQTPAWHFHLCDWTHPDWGWNQLKPEGILLLIQEHLKSFETMEWYTIESSSGGRRAGTNSHPLSVLGFTPAAQKRLKAIIIGGIEELFSLRVNNKVRVYGIKEGRVLKLVWYDPHHGSRRGAYPTAGSR
ncbi:MAG: hypothetical protein HQL90_11945 [Magnetococcales bacterium]|nr:hypothetical protein [Magnetococcales bacterium]